MRILITGARGNLGTRLLAAVGRSRTRFDVFAAGRRELDVESAGAVRLALETIRPDTVIHCAAATAVDDCTLRPHWAARLNTWVPAMLAAECRRVGAALVLPSTDFVFSGEPATLATSVGQTFLSVRPYEPGDPAAPLSVYGSTKLAGEVAARSGGARLLVVRTAWLFGSPQAFVQRMLALGRKAGRIRAVTDQIGSPTFTADLADALLQLIEVRAEGTVHFVNAGPASRFDVAREAVRITGEAIAVEPALTSEFPTPARRPGYSVLATGSFTSRTGREPRHWRDALEAHLREPG